MTLPNQMQIFIRRFEGNWLVCTPDSGRGEFLIGKYSDRRNTLLRWGVDKIQATIFSTFCKAKS